MKNFLTWMVAFALTAISGSAALGSIAKSKSPELALSLFPQNGFAVQTVVSGLTMASVVENKGNFPELADPVSSAMAQQAFELEAISPDAIAMVALSHTGDVRRELMKKAFELSRRQKIVTGWLIADNGKRNELSVLLDYYDTLLRTSSSADTVVLPVMAAALADERAITPFTSLISNRPPWTRAFWRQVVSEPKALGNAVKLRKALHKPDESTERYSDPDLVHALVNNKQFEEAEELYSLLSPRPPGGSFIRNGSFLDKTKYPPLDWQLFSTGEYGAAIANDNLQISAIPNSGGLFARQLVKLPLGVLQIDTKFAGGIPDDANMEIRISCAEAIANPPRAVLFSLTNQTRRQQISNKFSGCSYFWFNIAGRASENGDGFDIVLESISISPK